MIKVGHNNPKVGVGEGLGEGRRSGLQSDRPGRASGAVAMPMSFPYVVGSDLAGTVVGSWASVSPTLGSPTRWWLTPGPRSTTVPARSLPTT